MNYQVNLSRPADRFLDRVDKPTRERLWNRLDELALDPNNPRISKSLKNTEELRSSRVGGWRIIYTVSEEEKAFHVLAIRPRGQAYRDI